MKTGNPSTAEPCFDSGPDSGYPTPRDTENVADASNRVYENLEPPLTSTPLRRCRSNTLFAHFESFKEDLTFVEGNPTILSDENKQKKVVQCIKCILNMSKEIKNKDEELMRTKNESVILANENLELKYEVDSLKGNSILYNDFLDRGDENMIPTFSGIAIPKLALEVKDEAIQVDSLKEEYIRSQEEWKKERSLLENSLRSMQPTVVSASAFVKVDMEVSDAEVQTEFYENAQKFENMVDLTAKLQKLEEDKALLENKISEHSSELSNLNQVSNEDIKKKELRIENLELRLKKFRKENEELHEQERRLLQDLELLGFEKDEAYSKIAETEKLVDERNREILVLDERNKEQKQQLEELEAAVESLKVDKQEHELLANSLKENFLKKEEDLQLRLKESDAKYFEALQLEKENEQIARMKDELMKSNLNLECDKNDLLTKLSLLENEVESLSSNLSLERKQRTLIEDQTEGLKFQLKQAQENESELQVLREKNDQLLAEIDHLRKRSEKAEIEGLKEVKEEFAENLRLHNILQTEFDALKEAEANSKALMQRLESENGERKAEIVKLEEVVSQREIDLVKVEEAYKGSIQDYESLSRVRDLILQDYENYKERAQEQYYRDTSAYQEKVRQLEECLVRLETYPGQTIPVELVNRAVQVDEELSENVEKPQEIVYCNAGTSTEEYREPVRQKPADVNRKLDELIEKLAKYNANDDMPLANECRKIVVHLLEDVNSEQKSSVASASRFRESLLKILKADQNIWKSKVDENEKLSDRLEDKVRRHDEKLMQLRKKNEEMAEQLSEELASHANAIRRSSDLESEIAVLNKLLETEKGKSQHNHALAFGFKEEFEFQLAKRKELEEDLQRVFEQHQEEKLLRDGEEKDLRKRLEMAESELEREKRVNMKTGEELLEENERLSENLQEESSRLKAFLKREAELQREIESREERIVQCMKKRERDQKEYLLLKDAFEKVKNKVAKFQDSNTERQKLLDNALNQLRKALDGPGRTGQNDMRMIYADLLNKSRQLSFDVNDKLLPDV
ncbi:unnamed protein product [Caenorhabditis auriculariae]|uniref:Uncharacterized protein n=1 Tax=Caenorhabditis auriculariae TaxID=2777116 RepID=A0A8S1GXP7_9PELO|nr:unnamed protein product [Caenorhabditis auriculariae]